MNYLVKECPYVLFLKHQSNHSNVNVIGFVKFSIFENGVNLLVFRMVFAERRIAQHKVIQIHNAPRPESIFTKPLHQRL